MATELIEIRPGRWYKVVNGEAIGPASADEVAAWRQSVGLQRDVSAPGLIEPDLDVPLDAPVAPGRLVEPSLRPAFQRRGVRLQESGPPARADKRSVDLDEDMTIELAIAREESVRRREARARGVVEPRPAIEMVRRRRPSPESLGLAAPEVVSLPKPTPSTRPAPPRSRTAQQPVPEAAPEPVVSDAVAPQPEDAPRADASQSANYWWICNSGRQPAQTFLREWLPRYEVKFGHPAQVILCNEEDLAEAQALGLDVAVSPLLQPGHFYLSHREAPEGKSARKARPS
ncbi:MAG: hypothetical protein ACUVX9_07370 [Anaerolineae bacterium]